MKSKMKLSVNSVLVLALLAPAFSTTVTAEEEDTEPNWQMTWNDEFDGETLDEDKWRIDIGNGFYDGDEWIEGWGNNELQSYQEDNVTVEDGSLILEAREETVSDDKGEYDYTSGKVLTDESFSQAYGRFEASMKLPEGQGYWPAFWMMPQDDVYGGWAASGEIDIMENRGSETDIVGAAIHYGDLWPDNTYTAEEYHFPEDKRTTDFNEYAIEWEPGEIRWYVNDELYSTKTEWHTEYGEYPAPFDQEFHMILNLAVGGWYGGEPDETTEFPGQVEVDYVRVYEDADAEHPPPGDYIDPDEGENGEEEGPEPVDPTKNWEEIGDNLIEDGTFDETTEFGDEEDSLVWNVFNMGDHDPNGGLADFEVVDNELQATIEQNGWAFYHIQLMQDVSVTAGTYKLQFDMRSDVERPIYTELTGAGYRLMEIDVDEERTTYETYIDVSSPGDYSLLFGLGREEDDPDPDNPYDIHLDNVRLVEVGEDGEPTYPADPNEFDHWVEVGDNLVEDGTFEETTEFGDENESLVWNVFNMGDHDPNAGLADFEIVDEELRATIQQIGWESWHIQFMQDISGEAGTYKIEFDMRAEEDQEIAVELVDSGSGVHQFDIGEEMTTHSTYIQVDNPGDFKLMFQLGHTNDDNENLVPYDLYLDNVRLVEVEAGEEEEEQEETGPKPPVTPNVPASPAAPALNNPGNVSFDSDEEEEARKPGPPSHANDQSSNRGGKNRPNHD
ncbi:glycoside hydrolase family 16 protein [Salisediminibacterium beveridgei]|uniref:Glucan endo-1,3-beta-glucosidase A1 n=1 Tax=Salisediminibacterium beveridgei TaxID=632773 RepID=A0A1D7QRS9_9BACI|nr:glycoside hydrolase family 16 protein [Salisediminibacterium beveridgei]AOM81708.1 Glucan endo-1,3-beta-glucosidase A1 [Salisediminibacterium beveridgei]